jgi:hypothetical protein
MTEPVECYSGAQYAEKPCALNWQGQRLEISVIQAEWRTPVSHYFRVKTQDGQAFELAYFDLNNEWTIHPL